MYYRIVEGKNISYIGMNGKKVKKKKLITYFQSLVIPPAWTDVEINPSPRAKICATGYDAKGRKQYIYNSKFREKQEHLKFERIISFGEQLSTMRKIVGKHIRKRKLNREKVLATMLHLMETAYFRPGNELYTKQNKSFGLTTLQSKHLKINGNQMVFNYLGKSSKNQEKLVKDRNLVKIIKQLNALPGKEIFKFINDDKKVQNVKSKHLNQYIHEIMGEDFSAKDFRTWGGSVLASAFLRELGTAESKTQIKKNIQEAVKAVSEKLGNTPAIARKSYIDPRVFAHYEKGKTLMNYEKEAKKLSVKQKELSNEESAFLCMLKTKPTKK